MIAVIDYKMGNLGSVDKALKFLGAESVITSDTNIIKSAEAVILPGVGAMKYAYEQLVKKGLDKSVRDYIETGRPFLGICLGMQLMFERSEEGDARGLGILPGTVRRFESRPGLKIPHMGWNRLENSSDSIVAGHEYYYFVHSYFCEPADTRIIAASSSHGQTFTAAVRSENILLTQFHPEKSGDAGLRLLRSWLSGEVYK
jgi:glutamine amidotransferase